MGETITIEGKTTVREKPKPKVYGSPIVKCPKCGTEVTRQGLGGHMRFVHKINSLKKPQLGDAVMKKRKVETLTEWLPDPNLLARELADLLLKIFHGDEKKAIEKLKEVKDTKKWYHEVI
jgi:hypothetical protein